MSENKTKISARIDKLVDREGSKVRAYASLTVGGMFAIHGVKVIDSPNGPFVAMPQNSINKDGRTDYREICHPINSETRNEMVDKVMAAYEQAMQNVVANVNKADTATVTMTA